MKKLTFSLILLVSVLSLKAQTRYTDGFRAGYRNGYCYGIEPGGCVAPIPPIPPIPSNGEDPDSYQDGCNEGFSMGLAEQKKATANINQGYQTSSPESIDFIYKLNVGSILEIAAAQKQLKGVALGYYTNKDYNTCIALCSKLLPTDPYDSELYLLIGASYAGEKDYKRALECMKKAKQYEPGNNMYDRAIIDYEEKYSQSNKN